jgi:hypothetical protein
MIRTCLNYRSGLVVWSRVRQGGVGVVRVCLIPAWVLFSCFGVGEKRALRWFDIERGGVRIDRVGMTDAADGGGAFTCRGG